MAIISTLIGGIGGFISFLTALVFFNFGFLHALGLYALVGIGLTAALITGALTWRLVKAPTLPSGAPNHTYAGQVRPTRPTLAKRGG